MLLTTFLVWKASLVPSAIVPVVPWIGSPRFPDLLGFGLSSHGPTECNFGLDLLHSISYKLFLVSFTNNPVKCHPTVCSPIH